MIPVDRCGRPTYSADATRRRCVFQNEDTAIQISYVNLNSRDCRVQQQCVLDVVLVILIVDESRENSTGRSNMVWIYGH